MHPEVVKLTERMKLKTQLSGGEDAQKARSTVDQS